MARYFAKIENDEVVNVIVADPDFISTLDGEWIECGGNSKKRMAGKGCIFSRQHKNFVEKKPHPSWYLDDNCIWQPPVPFPNDGNMYDWDENNQEWVSENRDDQ